MLDQQALTIITALWPLGVACTIVIRAVIWSRRQPVATVEPAPLPAVFVEVVAPYRRFSRTEYLLSHRPEGPDQRARTLLLDHLSAKQRVEYRTTGSSFHCVGQVTGWEYRLQAGCLPRTKQYSFCIHSVRSKSGRQIPDADELLALKLMIELDELSFLKIANWTGKVGWLFHRAVQAWRQGNHR